MSYLSNLFFRFVLGPSELLLDDLLTSGSCFGFAIGAGGFVGGGVLRQPLLEVGKLTVTAVVNAILVVLRIEPDSWVSLGTSQTFSLIVVTVKSCNYQVIRCFLS